MPVSKCTYRARDLLPGSGSHRPVSHPLTVSRDTPTFTATWSCVSFHARRRRRRSGTGGRPSSTGPVASSRASTAAKSAWAPGPCTSLPFHLRITHSIFHRARMACHSHRTADAAHQARAAPRRNSREQSADRHRAWEKPPGRAGPRRRTQRRQPTRHDEGASGGENAQELSVTDAHSGLLRRLAEGLPLPWIARVDGAHPLRPRTPRAHPGWTAPNGAARFRRESEFFRVGLPSVQ
jgi:hypothetical protein